MPYSLVNTPALGYDLVRLPHGDQVCTVLRVALASGPEDLARFAARHRGTARSGRWHQALAHGGPESVRSTLGPADQALEGAQAADAASSGLLLRRLEQAAVGDLPALARLLRHEILDWTWLHSGDLAVQDPDHALGCDVLADAAASAYCSERLGDATRRAMAAPFLAARLGTPERPGDTLTGHPEVDALLRSVGGSDEARRLAWRRAVEQMRSGMLGWAPAMHQATWALHLSDRLRLAADAQLAAVQAFRDGGFETRDAAYGVWNAVSGAVHAMLAADLLPEGEHATLTAAWTVVRASDRD